jgi:hypothetical protein
VLAQRAENQRWPHFRRNSSKQCKLLGSTVDSPNTSRYCASSFPTNNCKFPFSSSIACLYASSICSSRVQENFCFLQVSSVDTPTVITYSNTAQNRELYLHYTILNRTFPSQSTNRVFFHSGVILRQLNSAVFALWSRGICDESSDNISNRGRVFLWRGAISPFSWVEPAGAC